jgi:multicomponent Na+:H+ antiporter subunit F
MTIEGQFIVESAALISLTILVIALFLALLRLAWGPSLPDRVVAFDLIVSLTLGIICSYSLLTDQSVFLDDALVLSLIGFLGTVAFAWYLEKRIVQ